MSRPPKRPHRATGKKPPGGARPGAGRPAGTTNALPLGAIQAIRAVGLRVPENTPAEVAELADRALQRVVDVMEERVSTYAMRDVLKAAVVVRLEVCGPPVQKVVASGPDGGPITVEIVKLNREGDE